MSMAALDSPMEALAINYLSYGVFTAVHNVWAWIAVVTAAISLWKIKSSTLHSSSSESLDDDNHPKSFLLSSPTPPPHRPCEDDDTNCPQASSSNSAGAKPTPKRKTTFRTLESSVGTTSGKFTVYYDKNEEDEDRRLMKSDEDDVDVDVDVDVVISSSNGGGRGRGRQSKLVRKQEEEKEGWEAVLRMKTEEMGWYRYQDLRVLDGNVVRLWDDHRHHHGGDFGFDYSFTSSIIASY